MRIFQHSAKRGSGSAWHVGLACVVGASLLLMPLVATSASSSSTSVKRGTGVKNFGKSAASTRNQGPKSKSYYSRGKTNADKSRERFEEWVDDLRPRSHQSGGYCMYGLDGSVIHAPAGRACNGPDSDGAQANQSVGSGEKATVNHIGQSLGNCVEGDCQNGFGTFTWSTGARYTGNFKKGRQQGHGKLTLPNGASYVGQWKTGMRWGKGTALYSSGKKLTGDWVKNKFVSKKRRHNPDDAYRQNKQKLATSGSTRVAMKMRRVNWPDLRRLPRKVGGGSKDAAVVIGIENYAHVSRIAKASDNATDWYRYLVKSRGVPLDRVTLLVDEDATVEEMRAATMDAADQVQKGGTLWFVFVGHGAPAKNGKDGLLIGFDAQQKARSLESRSMMRSDLLASLEDSKARSINVFLDACFSGKDQGGEQLVAGLQPLVVTEAAASSDKRMMLMTAARSDQFAGPLPGGGRPAFSYLTLGGLRGWADQNGNGKITASELHEYVSTAMKALVRDRKQQPTMTGSGRIEIARSAKEAGPDLSNLVMESSTRSASTSQHPAAPGGRSR